MANIENTTAFGGKPYPVWQETEIELPGYKNAALRFKNNKTNQIINAGFMVSPSGFNEQRSNTQQTNKTSAGWFIQRTGRALINLALSGYMLDTRNILERLTFIAKYTDYVEDTRNDKYEYVSDWEQTLYVEGIEYKGYILNLNFSKSAMQPFLYQYNFTFIAYSSKQLYHSDDTSSSVAKDALDILNGKSSANSNSSNKAVFDATKRITDGLYGILTEGR
jgi:hypothetical protein